MIIGMTGGSGAGKSFISGIFAENGFVVVDADAIAKEIMNGDVQLAESIRQIFGEEYVTPEGKVDRRSLGKLVFADREKLEILNGLTHPKILAEIEKQAALSENVVIDIPLLKGSSIEELCDLKVAVLCPREIRIKRIMQRDGIDEQTALNRLKSQLSDEEFVESTDVQIINNGKEDELKKQINEIIKRYVSDCSCE